MQSDLAARANNEFDRLNSIGVNFIWVLDGLGSMGMCIRLIFLKRLVYLIYSVHAIAYTHDSWFSYMYANSIFQAFGEMLFFNLLMLCLSGVIVEVTGCCHHRDCSSNMACKDAKLGCSASRFFGNRNKRGTCVKKQEHGSRVGFNSDAFCTSGEEQCAYCSKTCGTSKGCNVIPQCN